MSAPSDPSADALQIWHAGVDAVRADHLVARSTGVLENHLSWGTLSFDLAAIDRIAAVGAGKATAAMAAGLEQALGDSICEKHQLSGWVNVPDSTVRPLKHIQCFGARPAGKNEPTERAAQGAQEILKIVSAMEKTDLCIALISGGGSALLPMPRPGIDLNDKLAVTRFLAGAGANIEQLNVVRKHLSAIKGGGLLRACGAGTLVTLIISDVLGDPLEIIASGPTVIDTSSAEDALRILQEFDAQKSLPASVYRVLEQDSEANGANQTCAILSKVNRKMKAAPVRLPMYRPIPRMTSSSIMRWTCCAA